MGYKVAKLPGSWVYDIPLFGGHFAKIGHIQALYGEPCSPDPIIWVYGFFTAIPTLAASLTKPEIIDINIKHRRGKPRKGKKFKFTPDLLLRDAIIEIPVPRWVAFRVYELAQRIGWYFLVADATEDFAINWMTSAYKYQGCSLSTIWYMHGVTSPGILNGGTSAGLVKISYSPTAVSGISTGVAEFSIIHAGTYRVTWTVDFEPYGVAAQATLPYTTALYDVGLAKPLDIGELSYRPGPKAYASGSCIINADSTCGPFAIYAVTTEPGFFYPHLTITVDNVDDDALGPDP